MAEKSETNEIIESLSPIERAIIPYLNKSLKEIEKLSNLDETTVLRALKFLENKNILKLKSETKKLIDLGTNGIYYKKAHLPERRLLGFLEKNPHIPLEEAKTKSKLSDNEFKVSLGVLKSKVLIELKNNKIVLKATKEELTKQTIEEKLLATLPRTEDSLKDEEKLAYQNLKKRREIIQLEDKKTIKFELTPLGESLAGQEIKLDLIEEVTPEIIKSWSRTKKLRRYDIKSEVPKIYGGKRHFVNETAEYARRIWLDLGFEEMQGTLADTSFWIFDALFTPQDHPARELQDTYFISHVSGKLPDKKLVNAVKKAHETGIQGSKGWNYKWEEDEARKVVLRTHTTGLSAQTISKLKQKDLPRKFFAIGRVFRNETVDAGHLFEFNQTEGIVIDKNANFENLLGYLKAFLNKMGFEKIRFRPHYFPYTEPSVEADVYNEKTGKWVEALGAGIFRPELIVPLFGEYVPVLAWGMGFDRLVKENYNLEDIRALYANDLAQLRDSKAVIK